MPDKIEELYAMLKEKQGKGEVGEIPSLDQFRSKLSNTATAKEMYESRKDRFPDIFGGASFDEWYPTIKKKEVTKPSEDSSKPYLDLKSESSWPSKSTFKQGQGPIVEQPITDPIKTPWEQKSEDEILPKTNFERRIWDKNAPTIDNGDGTFSSHKMLSFEADGKFFAAPTIVEKNGKLVELSPDKAIDYALKTGEYKQFKSDAEARDYAENGYKLGTPMQESSVTSVDAFNKKYDTKYTDKQIQGKAPISPSREEAWANTYKSISARTVPLAKELEQTNAYKVQQMNERGDPKYNVAEDYQQQIQGLIAPYQQKAKSEIEAQSAAFQKEQQMAYEAKMSEFRNSLPKPKTKEEADSLNEALQKENARLFGELKTNIGNFNKDLEANYESKIYSLIPQEVKAKVDYYKQDLDKFLTLANKVSMNYKNLQTLETAMKGYNPRPSVFQQAEVGMLFPMLSMVARFLPEAQRQASLIANLSSGKSWDDAVIGADLYVNRPGTMEAFMNQKAQAIDKATQDYQRIVQNTRPDQTKADWLETIRSTTEDAVASMGYSVPIMAAYMTRIPGLAAGANYALFNESAGRRWNEIKDDPNKTAQMKVMDTYLNATSEVLFEQLGALPIAGLYEQVGKTLSKEAFVDSFKEANRSAIKKWMAQNGMALSFFGEGAEELWTGIAQRASDYVNRKEKPRDVDGNIISFNSFVYDPEMMQKEFITGSYMGTVFVAPAAVKGAWSMVYGDKARSKVKELTDRYGKLRDDIDKVQDPTTKSVLEDEAAKTQEEIIEVANTDYEDNLDVPKEDREKVTFINSQTDDLEAEIETNDNITDDAKVAIESKIEENKAVAVNILEGLKYVEEEESTAIDLTQYLSGNKPVEDAAPIAETPKGEILETEAVEATKPEESPVFDDKNKTNDSPLREQIMGMKGSAEDKLIALSEYESKYNLTEGAKKNADKIREELVSIRDEERKLTIKSQPKAEPKPKEVKVEAPAKEQEVVVKAAKELGISNDDANVLALIDNAKLTPTEKQILWGQYNKGVMNLNDVKNYSGVVDLEKLNSGEIDKWSKAILEKQKGKKFNAEDIEFEDVVEPQGQKRSEKSKVETQNPILSETTASENKAEKVTPVNQGGKTIIDENGDLTQELSNQFESLKAANDLEGLDKLYSTVRIFLNGVAQSKGEKTVKQFEALKSEIEAYSNQLKTTTNEQVQPIEDKAVTEVSVKDSGKNTKTEAQAVSEKGAEVSKPKFQFKGDNPMQQGRVIPILDKKVRVGVKIMPIHEWIESMPPNLEVGTSKIGSSRSEKGYVEKMVIGNSVVDSKAEQEYYEYIQSGGEPYSTYLENKRVYDAQEKAKSDAEKAKRDEQRAVENKEREERVKEAKNKMISRLINEGIEPIVKEMTEKFRAEIEALGKKTKTQKVEDEIAYQQRMLDQTERQWNDYGKIARELYQIKDGKVEKKYNWEVGDSVKLKGQQAKDEEVETKIEKIRENPDGSLTYIVEKKEGIVNPYVSYELLFPIKKEVTEVKPKTEQTKKPKTWRDFINYNRTQELGGIVDFSKEKIESEIENLKAKQQRGERVNKQNIWDLQELLDAHNKAEAENNPKVESPKKEVRKKVVAMAASKASGKTISEWKKEALDLVDKSINAIINANTDIQENREMLAKGDIDFSYAIDDNVPQVLRDAGIELNDKGKIIVPTPNGALFVTPSTLFTIRKEIAKLSDSKAVSNDSTRIKGKASTKVDAEVASYEFYEPETKQDAQDEFGVAKEVLDNAKKSGNKKLVELAQVQYDYYKDWNDNYEDKERWRAEHIADIARSKAAEARVEAIKADKNISKLYSENSDAFNEANIGGSEDLWDFLRAIGVEETPAKATPEIMGHVFAKAAMDKYKHSYMTYLASLADRKRDIPKITARSSSKTRDNAWSATRYNEKLSELRDMANKYEKEATKIFNELSKLETNSDKAIRFLDRLKIRAQGKALGVLPPFAIPIGMWNAAIDTIILSIKAGKLAVDAIEDGINYLRSQNVAATDQELRSHLSQKLGVPQPAPVVSFSNGEFSIGAPQAEETPPTPPIEPTPTPEEDGPEQKKRRFTQQFIASYPNLAPAVSEQGLRYSVLPNKVSKAEAQGIIDYLGVEQARKEFSDMGNGIPAGTRMMMGQLLIQQMESEGNNEGAIDLLEELTERATRYGQEIQALAAWALLSPESQMRVAQRTVNKTRERRAAEDKPVTDKIIEATKQANSEAISEVLEGMADKVANADAITPNTSQKPPSYGSKNRLVSKAKYEELKKSLRGKFFSAVPPELIAMGVYHLEAGSRSFVDFSKAMVSDLGGKVKPYLPELYARGRETMLGDGYEITDFDSDDVVGNEIASKKAEVAAKKLERAIAAKNRKAMKEATSELNKTGIWGQYRDLAASRLKAMALSSIEQDIKESPVLDEFTKGLIRNMRSQIDALSPNTDKEKSKTRPAIEVIGDAFKNFEKYREVWEKAKSDFQEKYKDNPEKLEELDMYFGDLLPQPFSEKIIGEAVREGMKAMGMSISDIVKQHYTIYDGSLRTLTDKLIADAGLSGDEARALADAIQTEFNRIATKKKQQAMDKILSKKARNKPEIKSLENDLIRLSNLGAFNDSSFLEMWAEKNGYPKLTPDNIAEIRRLSDAVQEAREGFDKFRAIEDLLAYQANIKGVSKLDLGIAIWYSNILSGYTTQEVNFIANIINSGLLYVNAVAQNPGAAKFLLSGFVDGFGRGLLEGAETFRTGYSPIRGKVEVPNVLERKKFTGMAYPLNAWKYVSRVMKAADVIVFEALKEMRAYQLAYKDSVKMGMLEPNQSLKDRAAEIVGRSTGKIEAAQEQAQMEYEQSLEDINGMGLPPALKTTRINQAKRDRRRRVFELIEQGRTENMKAETANYAARGTYNYKPEGMLGWVASQLNQAKDALNREADNSSGPISKASINAAKMLVNFVIPFTNIIANVANENINYTPIGALRARSGKSALTYKGKELTPLEKRDLYVKSIIGTTLMAAIYALTQSWGDDDEPLMEITANGTGDYRKNYELAEQGWHPYSIRIGDKWISYQYSPLMVALSAIGNIRDYEKYHNARFEDEGVSNKAAAALGNTSKAFMDMTFLSTLNSFLSAAMDPNNADRVSDLMEAGKKSVTSMVVPNLMVQIAKQVEASTDTPLKEVRGTKVGSVAQHIPVVRNQYNDKINALGEPVIADTDKFISEAQKTPIWSLLESKNAFIGVPSIKSVTVNDPATEKDRLLTEDEYYRFVKHRGDAIREVLESNIEQLRELDNEEFKKFLVVLKREATKEAKLSLFDLE